MAGLGLAGMLVAARLADFQLINSGITLDFTEYGDSSADAAGALSAQAK